MSYADEIKGLTGDPGARRLGEIADELTERLNHCCPREPDFASRNLTVPASQQESGSASVPNSR